MFTLYRKFKVAPTISIQSLSQLEIYGQKENYKNLILSNCANKIFTGNAEYDEIEWWTKEFGTHREWKYSSSMSMDKLEYDSKVSGVKWEYVDNLKMGKLQTLTLGKCGYKIKGDKGSQQAGCGNFEFLSSKYKEPQKIRTYDFSKYSNSVVSSSTEEDDNRKKFNLKNIDFLDERDEFNPVQTDVTDSKYLFDNEDAIIVNLKKGNPNKQ